MSTENETLHIDQELDKLEQECSQLLALLRDRHVGLATWRFIVGQRSTAIVKIMQELGMVE